jgi:hypothetical protein
MVFNNVVPANNTTTHVRMFLNETQLQAQVGIDSQVLILVVNRKIHVIFKNGPATCIMDLKCLMMACYRN